MMADQTSTSLRAKLDDAQYASTVWKVQANGMIVQLTNDLKEEEGPIADLQNRLEIV